MGVKASLLSKESFQERDIWSGVEAIDSKEGRDWTTTEQIGIGRTPNNGARKSFDSYYTNLFPQGKALTCAPNEHSNGQGYK